MIYGVAFRYAKALELARFSSLVMRPPEAIQAELNGTPRVFAGWFEHAGNGTQAALIGCGSYNVLAFRATEVNPDNLCETWRDVKTDLMFRREHLGDVSLHRGFLSRYLSVRGDILEAARRFHKTPLFITGHSLGGALAKIASIDIKPKNIAAVYTFGAPRVGNQRIDESIGVPLYQTIHAADLVPRLPLLMLGYRRAGDVRYIDRGGRIRRSPGAGRLIGQFALTALTRPYRVISDHSLEGHYIPALEAYAKKEAER